MNIKKILLKRLNLNIPKILACVFIFALTATTQGATNFYTKLQNGDNVKMMNMGTSLSYGYALPEASRVANRWTGQLQTHLDGLFSGQTTIDNQAISASNSGNANTNFVSNGNGLQIIDNRLANHTAGTLDLVVFEYATNDAYTGFTSGLVSLAETTTNLNSLIAKVKVHSPNAEIILLSGTFFEPGSLSDTTRPDIELYNAAWKAVADADPDVYYSDAHSVFKAQQAADPTNYKTNYVPDDIHPTVAGHTIFRDAMIGTMASSTVVTTGTVNVISENSTTQNIYAGSISTTDLINAGQATLATATVTGSNPFGFVSTGINDGISTDTGNDNTFFLESNGDFPATATYDLDVSTNTSGYDITSIQSLMGWSTAASEQANQIYSVEVSAVGSATYTTIATVNNTPFSGDSAGSYETKVSIADTSGILATGVDSIRFTFSNPGGTTAAGTLIREIDVLGQPTAQTSTVQIASVNSTTANAYAGDISATDLIDASQSTLSGVTFSDTTLNTFGFPNTGVNDGASSNALGAGNTFISTPSVTYPVTITFNLDVSTNTLGYQISSIQSLMGWLSFAREQSSQIYSVEVSTVGDAGYTALTSVNYTPFSGNAATGETYDTKVTITDNTSGMLATGVDSIRFTFSNPGGSGGAPGTLIREIDVMGYPVGGSPSDVGITSPASRTIIQRSTANTADIPVQGTFNGSPDSIEARAVVMAGGGNSGTTTAWTTIDASPTGGSYSGSLTAVPAGGWYQIEVRSVTSGTPSNVTTREKIGVGDLFIAAGQSNSANYGGPAYTPTDDRICMRNSFTAGNWVKLADPIGPADGNGGSPWSRLGQLIADNENIPVGFVSVGVGGSRAHEWLPGTSHYDNRLKPTLQSFSANGFRAVLWHQGESDSVDGVTAAVHKSRLESIIDQSRIDSGWDVPWYISEVSFVPSVQLGTEEEVVAGQRAMVQDDANVHLGPSTDEFHLESKVLPDGIHFNADGLADHAAQWKAILYDEISASIINGDFEDNTTTGITTVSPLADNGVHSVNITENSSPSILDWRILASGGSQAAGTGGYFNPGNSSYTGAIDTINAGVLPNMSGRHAAYLYGGNVGDHFLQTSRALLKAHRKYTLTVALGVRDVGSDIFGDAKIEILANGQPLGAGSTTTAAQLDTLAGGSASGKFTDVSYSFSTTETITAGQNLAVRITKTNGGGSTYLDFDNVRLTEESTSYGAWQSTHWGGNIADAAPSADPDSDGLGNVLEFAFGFDPTASNHSQSILSLEDSGAFRVTRKVAAAANLTYVLESSTTLEENSWTTVPSVIETTVSSDGVTETVDLTRTEGWDSEARQFYRLRVTITN